MILFCLIVSYVYVCMYVWLDFRKGYRQLQALCPNTPPPPSSQTFQSQALIKMATV